MAYVTQTQVQTHSILERVGDFFVSMFGKIDLSASVNARVAQMDKLNAKSDEELKAIGLRREDIARYVFRDIYHI
ncbi:MAG: DUF1127 domain-containing protein [Litoreibacter sp.]|uniref:DUF1127 domain-containing protein n=1 Tax=Litoreibacter sp. TaxID=1969459 RepID=UPI00329909FD